MQLDCSFRILGSAYVIFFFQSQALGNILMRILQTSMSLLGFPSPLSFLPSCLFINKLLICAFSP